MDQPEERPEGIPGVSEPGPFPVGRYAARLREYLRARARVQLWGEVWNVRISRARVYFELRDGSGALPCAMWRNAFDALGLEPGGLADGTRVAPSFERHLTESLRAAWPLSSLGSAPAVETPMESTTCQSAASLTSRGMASCAIEVAKSA
mgnify:CR=1 FL=1